MVFYFTASGSGNRDDTQKSVNGNLIAGPNQRRGIRYAGHARQTVFTGDNGPMDEHAAPAFDNAGGKEHHKRHIGVNRIADQDFAMLKCL